MTGVRACCCRVLWLWSALPCAGGGGILCSHTCVVEFPGDGMRCDASARATFGVVVCRMDFVALR